MALEMRTVLKSTWPWTMMIHDPDLTLTMVGEDPMEIRASGASVIGDTLDLANVRLEFPGCCVT